MGSSPSSQLPVPGRAGARAGGVRTCASSERQFGDFAERQSDVTRLVAGRGGMDLMHEEGTRPVNKYLPPRPRKPLTDVGRAAQPADAGKGFFAWLDGVLDRI